MRSGKPEGHLSNINTKKTQNTTITFSMRESCKIQGEYDQKTTV